MITDSNIDKKSSMYWCVLANKDVQTLLDSLISKYNESKETLNEATPPKRRTPSKRRVTPPKRTKPPTPPKPPKKTHRFRTFKRFTSNVFNSSITKLGIKVGVGSVIASVGIAGGTMLTGKALEKFRTYVFGLSTEQTVDLIQKLKNSPDPGDQQMARVLEQQFIDNGGKLTNNGMPDGWNVEAFKDVLKTAGITVACVGAAYALWKCRGMISGLFSKSEKSSKKASSNVGQAIPEPQGQTMSSDGELIAKCQFTANGQQFMTSIDTDTCKWSLSYQDESSGSPSDEDVKSYFKTKHFKNLTGRCYQFMSKYVGTEAFEKIAEEIQHANVPDDAKNFFKEIASNRNNLLSNLKSGAFNS